MLFTFHLLQGTRGNGKWGTSWNWLPSWAKCTDAAEQEQERDEAEGEAEAEAEPEEGEEAEGQERRPAAVAGAVELILSIVCLVTQMLSPSFCHTL